MKKKQWFAMKGFTLIELIVIIAMVGILGVFLFPNWTASNINVAVEARRLLNDIRYTQALSLTTGQRYRLVGVTSSTYQILNEAGAALVLPTGGTTATLAKGVTLATMSNLPNALIAFDAQGIPYSTSGTPGTALASQATITLTNGIQSESIVIYPQTGFGEVL